MFLQIDSNIHCEVYMGGNSDCWDECEEKDEPYILYYNETICIKEHLVRDV